MTSHIQKPNVAVNSILKTVKSDVTRLAFKIF